MPLDELLMERFKVRTRAVENPEGKITASTTAQLVLGNNPNRFAFIIVNLGAKVCYLSLTNGVSSTEGIRLDANGGYASMLWDEDFQMVAWAWWAVSTAAATRLVILEVVEI